MPTAEPTISAATDPGGRPCWRLTSGRDTVLVAEDGAQVLSYERGGADVLWTASKPEFASGKPVRGGIPLVFPWFNEHATDKALPAHGFARNLRWRRDEAIAPSLVLTLESTEATRRLWPHDFRTELRVDLGATLRLAWTITNRGTAPFRCEPALHTYFAVGDVERARVHGLEGLPCTEQASAPAIERDPSAPVTFTAETDRIYQNVPDRLELEAPTLHRRVVLRSSGARSAIVWNPWIAKTARLSQMAPDDWRRFCCVETAAVREGAIELAPGARHRMTLEIDVERA
jgi:glucose-6-phosphate 1-epimerase